MADRVLIPLPGHGVLALTQEQFTQALTAGIELAATAAQTPATNTEPLLDAEQAGHQLGVSDRWLEDSARAGIVPHYKLGRFIRFRVSEIAAHCRVDGAAIPGTSVATGYESVGRKRSFASQ